MTSMSVNPAMRCHFDTRYWAAKLVPSSVRWPNLFQLYDNKSLMRTLQA